MLAMIPQKQFSEAVESSGANRYTKHFTAWNQFIVNLYAQASGKKSLRDIEAGLRVQQSSWYHIGLKNISRSQLSYVNGRRNHTLYQCIFQRLLVKCGEMASKQRFRFKWPLQILDSTLVHLCLSVFPWAKYRKKKGALKIHTLLDAQGTIPSFVVVTDGKHHDVKVAKKADLPLCPDSILVMDKAYIDFEWLYDLHCRNITFVTRAKENMNYEVLRQQPESAHENVLSDCEVLLTGSISFKKYPDRLRLVTWHDPEHNKIYTFMTNNLTLSAKTIADIYKARWDIETFFKWIKQNLKIKTFLGTSLNAVMTQIWTALIYYLLLAYIKYQTRYAYQLLHFTRVIREALFQRIDIIDLLKLSPKHKKLPREPDEQRLLFDS